MYVLQIRLAKTKRGQPKHISQLAHQLVDLNRTKARLLLQHNHVLTLNATLCAHSGDCRSISVSISKFSVTKADAKYCIKLVTSSHPSGDKLTVSGVRCCQVGAAV